MEKGRRKKTSRRGHAVGMLVPVVALLILMVACGDDGNDDAATPEPTEEATATADASNGATSSPTQPPVESLAPLSLKEYVITMERTRARRGTVTFQVRNEGELTHEFVVVRTDIDKDELPRKPNDEGVDESELDVVGRIDSIAPGATGEVTIDVEDGNYVVFCNFYVDGTSHYLDGMYQEFQVTPTAPIGTPLPSASPSPTP